MIRTIRPGLEQMADHVPACVRREDSVRKEVGAPLRTIVEFPDRLLRVDKVAEILAISVRSVWRMASDGSLPVPVKVGGSTRWRESELKGYLAGLGKPARDAVPHVGPARLTSA